MAYVVDPQTLEFDSSKLTNEERADLISFAVSIVRKGYTNVEHPAFVAWLKVSGLGDVRQLLAYSTVFPQKTLVSFSIT